MESVSDPHEITDETPQPPGCEVDTVAPNSLQPVYGWILAGLSLSHLLNDSVQALIPAIYPLLKQTLSLNFTQVGLITFTLQMTGSLFQPFIGHFTDRKPQPFSLAVGMAFTLIGVVSLAFAPTYGAILVATGMVGLGSAVFHPEASRIARRASGGRHGFAQSLFQVGGNAGSAIGPLLAALIVMPRGQQASIWFSIAALLGILILSLVGKWYAARLREKTPAATSQHSAQAALPRRTVIISIAILLALVFSKYFYLVSMTSYYTFYSMARFHVSAQRSQLLLFVFLAAVAAGTYAGGPVGDRIGRKRVIWVSILGVAPFTMILPYANQFWTITLSIIIGLILSSAFSAILVYATELVPGRVGLISGLFFGAAFGMAGIGAAVLGKLADMTSIIYVYKVCAYLPLIGLLTGFLPEIESTRAKKSRV
jgi:MFS transporter, FSR family, fosmidomycin resistance protein